jgi:pre-mRNA branch site protein p14
MTTIKKENLSSGSTQILFVRNLPFKIKNTELYDIFGKYGGIHQIRLGNAPGTRGTAYVVYDDVKSAKLAHDHLSGFSVAGRYLVCGYFRSRKQEDSNQAKNDETMKDE